MRLLHWFACVAPGAAGAAVAGGGRTVHRSSTEPISGASTILLFTLEAGDDR